MSSTLQPFFDQYAEALLSFSAESITAFYTVPMAVFSDSGNRAVNEMHEVTAFWEQGVEPYQAQNITKAVPAVVSEEQLSGTLFTCKVSWTNFDEADGEVSGETNFYIVQQTATGFKICGLVIMNID
jgi:hypothetical protein